jgi:hypothetical protein
MSAIQELTAAVQKINEALSSLRSLDNIEARPRLNYERLEIKRNYNSYDPLSDAEKAICASMLAAGKRRAAELGHEARAEAIEKATAVIASYRAILPHLAAKAAIEIGAVARDAT